MSYFGGNILDKFNRGTLDSQGIAKHIFNQPDKLNVYLSMLSDAGKQTLLQAVDKNGNSLLHEAAFYPEIFKKLLALCNSDEDRLQAVISRNAENITVLHHAASNDESFAAALDSIPENPQLLLSAADDKKIEMNSSSKHLINFAKTPNQMLKILSLYAPDDRVGVLTFKPLCDKSAVQTACKSLECFKAVLSMVRREHWQQLIIAAEADGYWLLQYCAEHDPAYLLELLALYPEHKKYDAIIARRPFTNDTLLNCLNDAQMIIAVVNLLPEYHQVELLDHNVRGKPFNIKPNFYITLRKALTNNTELSRQLTASMKERLQDSDTSPLEHRNLFKFKFAGEAHESAKEEVVNALNLKMM